MVSKPSTLVVAVVELALTSIGFHAWLASRDDLLRMQATLAAQKQLLSEIDAREHARAADLKSSLDQIAALKHDTHTPQQILRTLPQYLPLPEPIALEPTSASPKNSTTPSPSSGSAGETGQGTALSENLPDAPVARVPAADLKPLFDFVQDCRASQIQLAAARIDLRDEQARSAALTRARDAAVKAARGGSLWTRARRNAIWFVVGAAAATILSGHL